MKADFCLFKDLLKATEDDALETYVRHLGFDEKWKDDKTFDEVQAVAKERERRILYHLSLLVDARMIDGVEVRKTLQGAYAYGFYAPTLTLKGNEFYSHITNSRLLQSLRVLAEKSGSALTIGFVVRYAEGLLDKITQTIG